MPGCLLTNMSDRPTVRFIYNVIRDRNYSREDYIMSGLARGKGRPPTSPENLWPPIRRRHYSRGPDSLEGPGEINRTVTSVRVIFGVSKLLADPGSSIVRDKLESRGSIGLFNPESLIKSANHSLQILSEEFESLKK